jgi:hypothetical protein
MDFNVAEDEFINTYSDSTLQLAFKRVLSSGGSACL